MKADSVLLVDDSPLYLDALSRHLRRKGYEVATAARGRRALERMEGRGVDRVLLDVLMPDLGRAEARPSRPHRAGRAFQRNGHQPVYTVQP